MMVYTFKLNSVFNDEVFADMTAQRMCEVVRMIGEGHNAEVLVTDDFGHPRCVYRADTKNVHYYGDVYGEVFKLPIPQPKKTPAEIIKEARCLGDIEGVVFNGCSENTAYLISVGLNQAYQLGLKTGLGATCRAIEAESKHEYKERIVGEVYGNGYAKGVEEQREIDIEIAWELMKSREFKTREEFTRAFMEKGYGELKHNS